MIAVDPFSNSDNVELIAVQQSTTATRASCQLTDDAGSVDQELVSIFAECVFA
jgi:hypothetical protein